MKLMACKPLVIYLILTSLSFASSLVLMLFFFKKKNTNNNGVGRFIVDALPHTFFFIITTALLYFLCYKGYTKIAWVIISLKLFVTGILIILGLSLGAAIIKNKKK